MRRRTRTIAAIAACTMLGGLPAAADPAPASIASPPFITSKRPYLVDKLPGLTITPILTTGDVIGPGQKAYQMSGVPDGIGLYRSSPSDIEVFMNHELDGDPSLSRISHLTLNNAGAVKRARYPIDGSEGFEDFCSSTLTRLDGTWWYTTGEEGRSKRWGGVAFAMNTRTGRWFTMPHFGFYLHENVVPMKGMKTKMIAATEDGRPSQSQVFAYTAPSWQKALHGHGTLRVFAADRRFDGNPSPDDIKMGESMRGHWASLPDKAAGEFKDLERAAQAANAFDFVRPEDATADPNDPGVLYMADTGAAHREDFRGSIYRFVTDPKHPTQVTLRRLVAADRFTDKNKLFNPDNLGISGDTLMINEDRNYAKSGFNKIWSMDLSTGALTKVARTDPAPISIKRDGGPGAWESSGIVDASAFFGPGSWLTDVQAGDFAVRQPGPSLKVDSANAEGGQLLLIQT